MIAVENFYSALIKNHVDFFTGVPDSLLKEICGYITENTDTDHNFICANEGNAIALATGYHLSTGKIPLVYLQNSGMGNITNPITSLTDKQIYSIPLILMIGWRGEPGVKDEPQHIKQGRITLALLEALEIPDRILDSTIKDVDSFVAEIVDMAKSTSSPAAIVVRKGSFQTYKLKNTQVQEYTLTREQALQTVVDELSENDIVVSTTGKTSRELFEYREQLKQDHNRDFLTVGSMGHSNHIALGIAVIKKERDVYCFDGDGAALMHLGSLPIIGSAAPANYNHIIFNNGSHDSVGGQPTVGQMIDFCKIANASGYKWAKRVQSIPEIISALKEMHKITGPKMLEIMICKGARNDLGRPTTTPLENKTKFMKFLSE
jgi:phosphonopyruvate decarboxylase